MINTSITGSSGYKTGTPGYRSTDARTRTGRSRANNNTQGSGAYWRSVTGTQHKSRNHDDNGSEVQLNEIKGGKVLKTEEIRISSETCSHDEASQFPSGSGRPMGLEPAHIA